MTYFINYYQSAIERRKHGLKLVLGGTGLGKTRSIVDVLKLYKASEKQFIYVANRVQLLEEIKSEISTDIELGKSMIVHQQSDSEIMLEIVRVSGSLNPLDNLLSDDVLEAYAAYLQFFRVRNTKITEVRKAYRFLVSQAHNKTLATTDEGNELIRDRTGLIMRFLKNVVRTAKEVAEGKLSIDKLTDEEQERYSERERQDLLSIKYRLSVGDYQTLLKTPVIQALFPYLQFKNDPTKRIFLVTLQKAFYGFFDGSRSVDLYHLDNLKGGHNGGYVIFMDEFDFLESDLISLLAKDAEISRPFKFVEEFYFAMTQNKLPYVNFLDKNDEQRQLRQDIDNVLEQVRQLATVYNIDYPNINHFICNEPSEEIKKKISQADRKRKAARTEEKRETADQEWYALRNSLIRGNAIFQTRYTISPNRTIYLEELSSRPGSLNLTLDKTGKKATAYTLLDTVNQATAEIIRIFKEVEFSEPTLYRSLIRYCFDSSDSFQRVLRNVRQYPLRRRKADSNYDKLQYNGFGMYEMQDLQDEYDPEEVYIRYYAIFTTPEKIMHHLTKHNLVFGLSATAEIPRLVRNFDVSWLRKELQGDFIEPTTEDLLAIAGANHQKQQRRGNKLTVLQAQNLTDTTTLQHQISVTIDEIVRQNPSDDQGAVFKKDSNHHRRNRVKHFFATLFWAIDHRTGPDWETDTHLLFFSSYRQIKFLFDAHADGTDDRLWRVRKEDGNDVFDYYTLTLQSRDFIVVFYNADKAREVHADELNMNRYYELFGQGKPVVLITTYPSAGNGVNLQYYDAKRLQMPNWPEKKPNHDFINVHLLDSPFFFFSPFERDASAAEQHASIKTNIYYLAKLMTAKLLTYSRFKEYLTDIRGGGRFNSQYIKTPDGILNLLASHIQAMGRIERVWQPMPDQTIRLAKSVYDDFTRFAVNREYEPVRERLTNYFSSNMTELMNQLTEQFRLSGQVIAAVEEQHLMAINQACQHKLQDLLTRLTWVRQHPGHAQSKTWRNEWERLRQAVLKHDFSGDATTNRPLLHKYACVFETDYYDSLNQCLWISKDLSVVPRNSANSDFEAWRLNSVYTLIKENDVVRFYFEREGYELGFNTHRQYLTPYAYQSLLAGAIGEECVKALLLKQDVPLASDEIPDQLFELADLKVRQHAWYIDAKNYSEQTLLNFALNETDPFYHPKLNEDNFRSRAIQKVQELGRYYTNEDVKLIFLNTFSTEDRPVRYFDINDGDLIEVAFDFPRAKIIFIFGLLDRDDPNRLLPGFETFISHLRNFL